MSTAMWKQYKKTAPFMQCGILLVTICAYFATGRQLFAALVFFAVMEVAAVLGAAWGYSMTYRKQRNTEKRNASLPLQRRK